MLYMLQIIEVSVFNDGSERFEEEVAALFEFLGLQGQESELLLERFILCAELGA